MTDTAWIDAALTSARPQAVGALLRYFRNLDTAEEAFQNACLRGIDPGAVGHVGMLPGFSTPTGRIS